MDFESISLTDRTQCQLVMCLGQHTCRNGTTPTNAICARTLVGAARQTTMQRKQSRLRCGRCAGRSFTEYGKGAQPAKHRAPPTPPSDASSPERKRHVDAFARPRRRGRDAAAHISEALAQSHTSTSEYISTHNARQHMGSRADPTYLGRMQSECAEIARSLSVAARNANITIVHCRNQCTP